MMINFLLIVLIIAVAAWLANGMMNLERALTAARAKVKASHDTVARLEDGLTRLRHEAEKINEETDQIDKEEEEARVKLQDAQRRLADTQAKIRQRLLIISDRRDAGDKEWIVTVANPQIGEIDGSHPFAQEWLRGRDYLVWASGEREAGERTMRRFSARPGFTIRSVVPAPENIYSSGPAVKSG